MQKEKPADDDRLQTLQTAPSIPQSAVVVVGKMLVFI